MKIGQTSLIAIYGITFIFFLIGNGNLPVRAQDVIPTEALQDNLSVTSPTLSTQELFSDQIILRLKSNYHKKFIPSQADFENRLSQTAGNEMRFSRQMSGDALVFRLPKRLSYNQISIITARLMTLPEIEYAEVDQIMRPTLIPNDPYYSSQWDLQAQLVGINAPGAWDITKGNSNIVVAVIDSGILFNHPDLSGRTVPGYDFISDVAVANDGNGRDADPSDPGNWCGSISSSWHGSHVAGTIAAKTNNSIGIAGIDWYAKILPVRVLGSCGGYESDIVDGMRWAAGLNVYGVTNNPYPARVLNLSFGGRGSCDYTFQTAINEIRNNRVIIVAAAGNDDGDANDFTPANCSGVISVAATDHSGNRAYYSNYGGSVAISAPGGDTTYGILSTINAGLTSPTSSYTYAYYQGTSMAAPHVTGVISLMLSRNPALTPDQVLSILQSTATPFSATSTCNTSICGSGIVNAANAVFEALPIYYTQSVFLPLVMK